MSVPLTLLGLLEREPSHGYDLKRDYDSFFGREKPLPYGQVYVIPDAGATEFEAGRAQPADPEPHMQTLLFTKVVLALMLGRPAEQYLDAQRGAHLQRMRELTEVKRTGELVDTLLADHGLFHLE